jgi:hypothetical protein
VFATARVRGHTRLFTAKSGRVQPSASARTGGIRPLAVLNRTHRHPRHSHRLHRHWSPRSPLQRKIRHGAYEPYAMGSTHPGAAALGKRSRALATAPRGGEAMREVRRWATRSLGVGRTGPYPNLARTAQQGEQQVRTYAAQSGNRCFRFAPACDGENSATTASGRKKIGENHMRPQFVVAMPGSLCNYRRRSSHEKGRGWCPGLRGDPQASEPPAERQSCTPLCGEFWRRSRRFIKPGVPQWPIS